MSYSERMPLRRSSISEEEIETVIVAGTETGIETGIEEGTIVGETLI